MYIVTKTTAYGVTADYPETEILLVTDKKSEAEKAIRSQAARCEFVAYIDDISARWVDEEHDTAVVVQLHTYNKK